MAPSLILTADEDLLDLGDSYFYGDGVDQDMEKAVRLYQTAAEQGSTTAQVKLGMCYYNGNGVKKNSDDAVLWFTYAATEGHVGAKKCLEDIEKEKLLNAHINDEDAVEPDEDEVEPDYGSDQDNDIVEE